MDIFKFISEFLKNRKIVKQISNQLTLVFFGIPCGVPLGAVFGAAASEPERESLDELVVPFGVAFDHTSSELELLDELSELLEVLVDFFVSFLFLPTLPQPKTAGAPCFLPRPLTVCLVFTIFYKFRKFQNG